MSTLLITDTGEVRTADCPDLRRMFMAQSDIDFAGFAVRNMGFIAYRRLARAVRIQIRPRVVSKVALTKLFQLLVEERPERVGINFVEAQSTMEQIVGDWARALRALDWRTGAAQDGLSELFLRRRRNFDQLDARDPLAGVFGRWRDRSGEVDIDGVADVVGRRLLKRHFVFEPPTRGSGALILRSLGGGFPTYNADWHARGDALSLHHPDYYYGKWVTGLFHEALARREPSLDDVDALISRPRLGRERFRYRRLSLPIRGRDGMLRVLGVSVLDPGIDLRVKVRQEAG
jgi:hypothetical protein